MSVEGAHTGLRSASVLVKEFSSPRETLGRLDADAAAKLVAAGADIVLVLDGAGIVRDVAITSPRLAKAEHGNWIGRPWAETVTGESRSKVEILLRDAASDAPSAARQVNHSLPSRQDVPVLYSTLRTGRDTIVAIGRDLGDLAHLQQQLVGAQQTMERDYWRLRHAETRYRLLFELSSEPVLIVDAADMKVTEINQAACEALGDTAKRLTGQVFPIGLDPESARAARTLLAGLQAGGRSEALPVQTAEGGKAFSLSAALFRREGDSLYLVRLSPAEKIARLTERQECQLKAMETAPDGFVVSDPAGRILYANPAFLAIAELATEAQAKGATLERWLGQPGVHMDVIIANLRQHGSVRLFNTIVRGEYGARSDVEVSAAAMLDGANPCLGFTIRNIDQRLPSEPREGRELPRSVEQLTALIGRVPLKDLVREATDLIERLCIEAALELTGDNRASAAEMLGLSRQSLYVKLRRFGISDGGAETDEHD